MGPLERVPGVDELTFLSGMLLPTAATPDEVVELAVPALLCWTVPAPLAATEGFPELLGCRRAPTLLSGMLLLTAAAPNEDAVELVGCRRAPALLCWTVLAPFAAMEDFPELTLELPDCRGTSTLFWGILPAVPLEAPGKMGCR